MHSACSVPTHAKRVEAAFEKVLKMILRELSRYVCGPTIIRFLYLPHPFCNYLCNAQHSLCSLYYSEVLLLLKLSILQNNFVRFRSFNS